MSDNYNIVDSFETGYRYSTVGGSMEQYRSTVNFGNGIRLLGSSLIVNSKNGHGRLFDQITLSTQGLGNDPYESAVMRIEKNRMYRYDMSWRRNDYFNPGLVTAGGGGQHLLDTQNRMQDHNLTLFPQSNLKFFAGFSASSQEGPGYSSIQLFDGTGDIFPLFSNVRRVWREYRLGNEFRVFRNTRELDARLGGLQGRHRRYTCHRRRTRGHPPAARTRRSQTAFRRVIRITERIPTGEPPFSRTGEYFI